MNLYIKSQRWEVPRQRFFTGSNTVTPPTRSQNDFSGTNIVTHCPCMNQRHPCPRLRSFQRIVFDKHHVKLLKCPFAPSQHSVELPTNQSPLRLLSTRLYWLLTFAQAPRLQSRRQQQTWLKLTVRDTKSASQVPQSRIKHLVELC